MHTAISSMTELRMEKKFTFPLILLFIYVLAEYGRPKVFAPLHIGIVLQILLLIPLMMNANSVKMILKDGYFKLYILLLMEMTLLGFIAVHNYWAFQAFTWMISFLIFGLAICSFVNTADKLRLFLTVYVIVFALCAIDQIITGGTFLGGSGIMGDTNDFALAMNVVIPISVYLGLSHNGMKRFGFWLLTALFVAGNISTFSRGGFVGMAVVGFLLWLKSKAKARSLIIFLLIITLFIILSPLIPSQSKEGLNSTYMAEIMSIKEEGTETGTGRDRIELWKLAWKIFLRHPLVGIGQNNLPRQLQDYLISTDTSYWGYGNIWGRAVHSIYFTVLPELGIIGTLIWILMLKNLFFKYRTITSESENKPKQLDDSEVRFLQNITSGLFLGLMGYLVSGIFLSAFYYPHFWHLSALMTTTYMIKTRMEEQQNY